MTGQAEDRFWVSRVRCPTKQCFFARHLPIGHFFRVFFGFRGHSEPAQSTKSALFWTPKKRPVFRGSETTKITLFSPGISQKKCTFQASRTLENDLPGPQILTPKVPVLARIWHFGRIWPDPARTPEILDSG